MGLVESKLLPGLCLVSLVGQRPSTGITSKPNSQHTSSLWLPLPVYSANS